MSDEIQALQEQMLTRQAQATRTLAGGGTKSLEQQGLDRLGQAAVKSNADSIKFSQYMLKQRLVSDLDQTIQKQMDKHPEMKDNVFIGIVTGQQYSAEVVPLSEAAKAVQDVPQDQALQLMSDNPVGYFQPADFTMKTPDDAGYQEFKQALDGYFKRNSDIIDYLRQNPEANVDATDLYQPLPPSQ